MPSHLVAILFFLAAGQGFAAEPLRIAFPVDVSVIDAKKDLGAKGDGKTDDTDALQKGIDLSCGADGKKTKVLFLPSGTYKISKTLVVKSALGPWLYGETRDGTVICLVDGSKGVTCVLRTHPLEKGKTSADWFMRNIRNLTLDAGDNPEADGIRYYATNSGILQNVRIVGNGKVGLNAGFLDQSGPNLAQDVVVEGFETGVLSQWIWGQTLSRITVKKCRKIGLVVSANVVAVEDLYVEDTPQAIHVQMPNDWGHWAGVVAIVGGKFTGGDPKLPAIKNDGILYARNVKSAGFKMAIDSTGPGGNVKTANVAEYSSHEIKKLFEPAKDAKPLDIRRESRVAWETDLEKWVCADDFGANAGDNKDDTEAIQKAIDAAAKAGKTTVYFRGCGGGDPNWYTVDGEIKVHGSVRHILGLGWARVLGGKKGRFVICDDSAAAVKFQNIDSFGGPPVTLENRSTGKTLVAESSGVTILGTGTGDIFATDCPAKMELRKAGQKMWCRHLNPEGDSDTGLVINAGAELWILGMKFEGKGVRVRTEKAGRTEAYGVFNYGPGVKNVDTRPMFDILDASFAVHGLRELSFGGDCWPVKVREKRGAETRLLDSKKEGGWTGWSTYSSGVKTEK